MGKNNYMIFSLRRHVSKHAIDKKVTTEEVIYRNMAVEIVREMPFETLKNLFSFESGNYSEFINHYFAEIEVKTDEELAIEKAGMDVIRESVRETFGEYLPHKKEK